MRQGHQKEINETTYPDGPTAGKLQPTDWNDTHIIAGLLGHWRFNGSAEDSSPNGNDGSLDLGATVDNDVLNLDGGNDHCEVAAAAEITAAKDAGIMTMVGWFKCEDLANTDQAFVGVFVTNGVNQWWIRRSTAAGALRVFARNAGAGSGDSTGNLITDTDWHMFAFVVNSATTLVYMDGDLKDTLSTGARTLEGVVGSPKFLIGSSTDNGGDPWEGKADECMLFDRELSADEIRAMYENRQLKGDVVFGGGGLVYGEISVNDNANPTAIAVMGTAVQVTDFDTDGPSNNATPDHASDHITIAKAGDYLITCSLTMDSVAGPGATFDFEVMKNNGASRVGAVHAHRSASGGGGETGSVSLSGIATLAAADTIELWVSNDTGTENVVIEDAILSVVQIGG